MNPGTVVLHSLADDVVTFADSEELVRNSGLPIYTLVEVGNDHRLTNPQALEVMPEACSDDEAVEGDWAGLYYTAVPSGIRVAEDDDWVVVDGNVRGERAGRRIDHARRERGEGVVDLAMPAGAGVIRRGRYHRGVQPEVRRVYSSEDA